MNEFSKDDFFKITYIVTAFLGILVIGYFLNKIAYEQPYIYNYENDIGSISEELKELNRYMKVLCEEIEQTSYISSCR